MTSELRDQDGTTRLRGDLLIGGTTGDVATVQADGTVAPAAGGSLPDPITDPVNIAVDSDVVGLTVTAPDAGSANILEVVPDDAAATFAIDSSGRFRKDGFVFIAGLDGGGSGLSLPTAATYQVDSDNTGDYALKVTEGASMKLGFFNAAPVVQTQVIPIPLPGTATAEDCANAFNLLLAALGGTAGLGLVDDTSP